MGIKTDIHWCHSTINPIMGCLGCELLPAPEVVLERIDAAMAGICARADGQSRPIFTRLVFDAYDKIENPGTGHVRAVIASNIWNLRELFCKEIALRFGKATAKAALQTINESLKCYAWKLHIVRGQDITIPDRVGNKGHAPVFEHVTQFPGRVAKASLFSDLLGVPNPDKPWLDGLPRLIFVSDMGDAFSRVSDFGYLEQDAIPAIRSQAGCNHIWLWLTKRPEIMARFSQRIGGFPPNVCAMTTVTGPDTLHRIDELRKVRAEVKGLSIEPLLEALPLELLDLSGIDWVILGGESGAKNAVAAFDDRIAREMIEHCKKLGVAVFLKQLGANPVSNGEAIILKDAHGSNWAEWAENIRVRQFPDYFYEYRRAVVVKPKVLIGDESEKTFSVPKNSGTGKKPGQVVHNQGGDVKKTSHKNAAQVALTSVGVEEPGQTTAEAVDALSENSETAAGATAAVSKANANDQAHDAAQTVGAAERVGNNIPQGKICVVDVAGLELNPLSETLYGADAPEPLKTSIEEEGVTSPLIIARCSGKVLSGNTRLKIAREVGVEKVPVVYIEGQLTEEEETNLVITCNIERAKTREMKTLEYRELLRIEKGLAIRRRARKSADGDKVPNLEPGKSRDKAAAKIGVSASSLDTGLKVIEAMEKLRRKGDPEGAEVLRTKLNDEGFSSALNCASDNGWHMENGDAAQAGEGAGVQANEKARDPKGEVAVVKAGGGKKAAKVAVKPVDQKPPPELSQDEKDALKSAEEHIAGLEEYLHKKTIDRLSEAAKADLGRAMGRLNTAAVLAGINVIVD